MPSKEEILKVKDQMLGLPTKFKELQDQGKMDSPLIKPKSEISVKK